MAVGDRVSEGSPILTLEAGDVQVPEQPSPAGLQESDVEPARPPAPELTAAADIGAGRAIRGGCHGGAGEARTPDRAHCGPDFAGRRTGDRRGSVRPGARQPSIRRFARELGADLGKIRGSGPKGRILREDVQAFVKGVMSRPPETVPAPAAAAPAGGLAVAEMPEIDFSQFGEIETRALTKIKKLSGAGLHRNWVTIPHVTHQEEADITELEAFRKEMSERRRSRTSG